MDPKLILVVDDKADNRLVLGAVLRHGGYEVLTAEHGADALAKLCERRPALILLDLMMPVMDGWETIRRLKADPGTAGIPVAAVTALDLEERSAQLREAGFCGYYHKPLFLRHFLGAVQLWLEASAAGRSWVELHPAPPVV
jgi:CheY-like chemotaxis protein